VSIERSLQPVGRRSRRSDVVRTDEREIIRITDGGGAYRRWQWVNDKGGDRFAAPGLQGGTRMMHVHFHRERQHERERDLNRRLELNRLRMEGAVVAAQGLESKRMLTDPFRRARLLALHVKCLAAGG
jgi:hypothetical protein